MRYTLISSENLMKKIKRFFKKLIHLYKWSKVLWYDEVWDCHNIYSILNFKLNNFQKEIIRTKNHDYDAKTIKSLKLAIKLSARLAEEEYRAASNRHEKKWGKLESWTTPIQGSTNLYWYSRRPKAIFEKDQILEKKEQKEAWDADFKKQVRDRKLLFDILNKYLERWWD